MPEKKKVTKKKVTRKKVNPRALTEARDFRLEKLWKAEEDARTLARAEEIRKDPKRIASAKVQAKIMAAVQEKHVHFLKKIGQMPSKKE